MPATISFSRNARDALADTRLQRALANVPRGFVAARAQALERMPEFSEIKHRARQTKDRVLAELDLHLERFESNAVAAGAAVRWAKDAEDARNAVAEILRAHRAKRVVKSKTMIGEEIDLNPRLEREGIDVVETDLGEYILQLRGETPSHIVAPAIHLTREQIAEDFKRHHENETIPPRRDVDVDADALVAEARAVMRRRFLAADAGITGANVLIAENGAAMIVTNEGNADLVHSLPRTHIILASIEKVVPAFDDAIDVLRLLTRSATGQDASTYASFVSGPRRRGDVEGPEATYVILLDNGRSRMLEGAFRPMLRCVRCGACLNHCPVYQSTGGHAYGWVYAGPMGAVLTPNLRGIADTASLPDASTFCGRCEEVCPMSIPLPDMMRELRVRAFDAGVAPGGIPLRVGLAAWRFLCAHPRGYRLALRLAALALRTLAFGRPVLRRLPFGIARGWTDGRDIPLPERPRPRARARS